MKRVVEMLASLLLQPWDAEKRPRLCIDPGYDYQAVSNRDWIGHVVLWITARQEIVRAAQRRDGTSRQRWGVGRPHSRLYRFRRLLIR